jgi:DNA-binding PadR family transcriptional regulator
MLEAAGLVAVNLNDDGQKTYRLTEDGVRVGNMLAMVEGEEAGGC